MAMTMAINFNLNPFLNPNHMRLFQSTALELVVYGGANAGKSFSIADKLLLNGSIFQADRKIKTLVIRKTFPALRNTALDILISRAETFRLPFDLNKSEWSAQSNNQKFIFLSLNNKEDYQKLKSMTNVDYIWINEATEITENDYEECLRRLRGGEALFNQIIIDFNPISKFSWIYSRFFEKKIGEIETLRYTVFDNHPEYLKTENAKRYIARLEALKNHNQNAYKIYRLGEWGELEGNIFNWDVVPLPSIKFDEVFYGGDFGYSVDPAAVIRIYRKADEFWVEEVIYETGLTNQALGRQMKTRGVNADASIYFDSAEPKSIQELYEMGFNVKPSEKGPDSVRAGIDFLKSLTIHIVEGSENIIKEQKSYVWQQDKDGNKLPRPIEFNDHAMSAIRYGIYTHMKQGLVGVGTVDYDVRPY